MLSPYKTHSQCFEATCPAFLQGKTGLQNKGSGVLVKSVA